MRTLLMAAGLMALPALHDARRRTAGRQRREGRLRVGRGHARAHLDSNIKVKDDKTGKELSFALVPHFDHVFSSDGKSTYQMKSLHSGQLVKVYYDQKLLGAAPRGPHPGAKPLRDAGEAAKRLMSESASRRAASRARTASKRLPPRGCNDRVAGPRRCSSAGDFVWENRS